LQPQLLCHAGNDRDLDLAFPDEKHGIGHIPLRKDELMLAVFRYRPSAPDFGQEFFGIEWQVCGRQ
jgi:hypothetical protein